MNLLCRLGFHAPVPSRLWNDGHFFSRCTRCGVDMIRKPDSPWTPIPPAMKVVWRARGEDDVVWPQHLL